MQRSVSRKRKTSKRRKSRFLFFGLALVAVLGLSYTFVWQRVYTLELAEEYAERRNRVNELEDSCRHLRFEIAELSSMQRLEEIATSKFGLVPLRETQVVDFATLCAASADSGETPLAQTASSEPESAASPGSEGED